MKLSYRQKVLITILGASSVIFVSFFTYFFYRYQQYADQVKPYSGSYAVIISNQGQTITKFNGIEINTHFSKI